MELKMDNVIYYFSGTGNSLKVAKDMAEKLGSTELISISKAINQEMYGAFETAGIVFPVHSKGVPMMVVKFIKKLKSFKVAYYYAVATHGGNLGGALEQTSKLFEKRGMKLAAGFAVHMPSIYITFNEEEQNKLFQACDQRVDRIIQTIKNKKAQVIEKNGFLNNLWIGIQYKMFLWLIYKRDKSFWVNEKCNQCGICAKICPAENIELKDGRPIWKHNCSHCYACLQWCPMQALQYGKTTGLKRYTNPFISLKEMLQSSRN
ncbi:EFR1 family ferrodoxin [Sporomusa silvacetica]